MTSRPSSPAGRCNRARSHRLWRYAPVVLIHCLWAVPAFASVAAAPAYLKQMPEPDRDIADIRGWGKLDTAARQVAALNRLIDVNIGLSGHADDPGGPHLTTEELSLNGRYAGAASSIYMAVYRSLDPDNKGQSDENSSRNKWNRSRDQYYNDDAFISALLKRYLTPDLREQYLGQLQHTRQQIQAMNQHTQGDGNYSDQQAEPSGPFPADLNYFGVLGALVLLTLLPRRGPSAERLTSGWGIRLLRYAIVVIVCLWALVSFVDWPPDAMAFFSGLVALSVLYLIFRERPPAPGPSDVYGTAHYAPMQTEIQDDDCLAKGVFFGKSSRPGLETVPILMPGAPVCSTPEHHTLIVARTRTGKGTRVIIPTLLRYRGSALVIDPKGENAAITATARKEQLGQSIHILNPWNELAATYASRGFKPATYNPLDILDRDDPNVVATAQTLAGSICPAPANAKDRFWQGSAANVLTAVLLWLAENQPGEHKTLGRAREIVSLTRKDFTAKYLIPMAASEAFSGAIREMAAPFIDLADETYSGVMSNLSESTKFLSDPQIKAATAQSSFAMEDLATENATVYVVIPTNAM